MRGNDGGSVAYVPGGLSPWHMWGNTQIVELVPDVSDQLAPSIVQLIKVAHSRPDTWQWLFHARIVDAPTLFPGADTTASISIYWDVTTGLGRSAVQLPGFDHFVWTWTVGDEPDPPTPAPKEAVMWATSTWTPALIYGDPTSRRSINQIAGQDIQVNIRGDLSGAGSYLATAPVARVEVSAYMSPNCGALPGR